MTNRLAFAQFCSAVRRKGALALCLALCTLGLGLSATADDHKARIITFDAPGAGTVSGQGTQANFVDPEGRIIGFYLDANFTFHGFLRTPNGKFTTFEAPGAGSGYLQGTGGWGMSQAGVIAGDYVDANCVEHGYLLEPNGKFITFEAPGAGATPSPCANGLFGGLQGTTPGDINAAGEIGGVIVDANNVWHGFLRAPDGKFTTFDAPGAGAGPFQGTIGVAFAQGLNEQGTASGWYIDENYTTHGCVRTAGGTISTFDGPGEGVQYTAGYSTNWQGATVGPYLDANNLWHGFLRWPNDKITTIDVPGAGTGAYEGTFPEVMNEEGSIAGNYIDTNGANHGFVLTPDGRITKFDAPGAGAGSGQGTVPFYIGDRGAVTGYFIDANGVSHGFLRIP
jgi:hypothetical protein